MNSGEHTKIPDHELLCCVGRGSYGEVWLARSMMGRYRAVKIVFRDKFEDERPYERELAGIRKFEPISRTHDGLVDVLHVGRSDDEGYFFYIMEVGDDVQTGQDIDPRSYVSKTLAKEIALRGKVPFEECLRLGLSLSSALEHLHKSGFVHRDVKPANIVFVNGTAKLADIGLVTDIGRALSYVGTEGYIPPEGPGRPQADIYGLGKVIYEMSTGRDRQEFPELPADLSEGAKTAQFLELNEVIVKACHHDTTRRYQTAREMHADFAVLESGQSVQRLRWLERRWAVVKKVGWVTSVLAIILGLAGFEMARSRREELQTRQRRVGAAVANGTHDLEEGDFMGAVPHFVQALELDQDDLARQDSHRLRLGTVLAYCPKLENLWFFDRRINTVEFSPDGQLVLAAGWAEKAHVVDFKTGQAVSPAFGPKHQLTSATFSPDGHRVLTASEDGTASIWRIDTGEEILRLTHPDRVLGAVFSPRGERIATGCTDKKARIWDAATGKLLLEIGPHREAVLHVEFSPDGQLIVTASKDATAMLWNAATGQAVGKPMEHKSWVYCASFSPDSERLVTGSYDRKARLWQVATSQQLPGVMNHGDAVKNARFSPDGRYVITASWDSATRLWDASTGMPLDRNAVFRHSARVSDATFSADGHRILTSSIDGTIRVFDLAVAGVHPRPLVGVVSSDGTRYAQMTNDEIRVASTAPTASGFPAIKCPDRVDELALNRNGDFALMIRDPQPGRSGGKALQVWNVSSAQAVSPAILYTNSLKQTYLSDDGRRLATVEGQHVSIRDVANGNLVFPGLSHSGAVAIVVFARDQARLATASGDRVHVWNMRSGTAVFPPLKLDGGISHLEFSPNGRFLLTCTSDQTLTEHSARIWDTATGHPVGRPLQHRDGVSHGSFSPDGRRVVTASEDFTAIVWDTETGVAQLPAFQHDAQVHSASFSPDGRWVVTCSASGKIRVWDAKGGEPLTPSLEHSELFQRAFFVGDGWSVVTTSPSGPAAVWELPRENRPVEHLERLGNLLASRWQTAGESQLSVMKAAWRDLGSAVPADPSVSGSEISAWHERQARGAESDRNWFAARFHLSKMLAMHPSNPKLLERLARATFAMASETAKTQEGTSQR